MRYILAGILVILSCIATSDAHIESDAPWFFERTVLIESGGRIFAGIVWDSDTIVTVHHGIWDHETDIIVTDIYGNDIPAKLTHADPYSDVAILSAYTGMEPLEMSYAGPGDTIYAVGHPNGRPHTISGGIISSVSRLQPISIQHDATTGTGSSGGPLFDAMGRLVGMTTASDDFAFAVPYDIISNVIRSVDTTGTYSPGCLGILLDNDDIVTTIRPRMEGILHPGDIILSVAGGPPQNILYLYNPGDIIDIKLEDRTIVTHLGSMGLWFGVHACQD